MCFLYALHVCILCNLALATAPIIFTVNSCSWYNWTLLNWKIAHHRGDWNPRPLDYTPSALTAGLREHDNLHFRVWYTGSGDMIIFVCKGQHTKCQRCAGTSTQFRLWTVVRDTVEIFEVKNGTPLMGREPPTPRLYAECSDRCATVMWHFPVHGVGYWLCLARFVVVWKTNIKNLYIG